MPTAPPVSSEGEGSPPISTPSPIESARDVADLDGGPFAPTNLDSPKDLSDPQFPDKLLTFELDSRSGDAASQDVFYVDRAAGVALLASITLGRQSYRGAVESLADPAYQGGAVCGHPTENPDQIEWLMVGNSHVLSVGTAGKSSVEDVAAFTDALHDTL